MPPSRRLACMTATIGPATARVIRAPLEPRHQRLVVDRLDVAQHFAGRAPMPCARRSSARGRSWRSISAARPSSGIGQGLAQRDRGLAGLVSHHERDDRHFGNERGEKRQLHLERMLASVCQRLVVHDGTRRHQRRRRLRIDPQRPERGLEVPVGPDRDAVERHEVRRTDQDDDVKGLVLKEPVGVGRHRARVHQPCVRNDKRTRWTSRGRGSIARRAGEVRVNLRAQPPRVSGVPRAGNRGTAYRHVGSVAHQESGIRNQE